MQNQINEYFFPVTTPNSYCIADIFLACRSLLLGKESHVCGKVYGFLSEPYTASEQITLTYEDAVKIANSIDPDSFLPTEFLVNGKKIGPRDLLDAFLTFLLDGANEYTVKPNQPWQIDLDQFPSLRDLNYRHSWIHADTLNDDYLSNRLRYQAWTVRLPKDTKRMIFN